MKLLDRISADPVPYAFLVAILLIALLFLVGFVASAQAAPVAVATQGAVTVTFTDESCEGEASELVPDMRHRATYRDRERLYEGCYMLHPLGMIVVLYFAEDRSIAIVPTIDLKPAELPL